MDGLWESDRDNAQVIVIDAADDRSGFVANFHGGNAERRHGLGISHENRLQRVIKVGVENQFQPPKCDRLRPRAREFGGAIIDRSDRGVGLS